MARIARVVATGMPHHVTQRGNCRQQTFFNTEDSKAYLELMADSCRKHLIEIWAYCLMPNHVHFIAPKRAYTWPLVRRIGAILSRKAGTVALDLKERDIGLLRKHERTGRPLGRTHLYRGWSVSWVVD